MVQDQDKEKNECKIVNIFLFISFNICFGCSKELSHRDETFEYPQHMFWLRSKKINFNYALFSNSLYRIALVDLDSLQNLDSRHVRVSSTCIFGDKYQYLIKWLNYHFLMGFTIISAEEYFKINLIWLLEKNILRLWDTMIFVQVNHVTSPDFVLMS